MTNIKTAADIYSNALTQAKKLTNDAQNNTQTINNGPSFSDVLKTSLEGAVNAQHKSEKISAAAVAGQANITDVLQAVTEAEMTLNTVVAIRDKVISAYEQIMRSPI